MSFSDTLTITGKALHLKDPRMPQLATRKIYNPEFFFNDTYQHEIANHYRDYKLRPRKRRHWRRNIYVRYRRAAFYGVISGEQRTTLPMAVHNFPRFTATYPATAPRGRQTLCQGAPPDDTYNDTVRRIRRAQSCKEFKVLVERQLRWKAKPAEGVNRAEKWATAWRARSKRERVKGRQRAKNGVNVIEFHASDDDNCADVNDSTGKLNERLLQQPLKSSKIGQNQYEKPGKRQQQQTYETLKVCTASTARRDIPDADKRGTKSGAAQPRAHKGGTLSRRRFNCNRKQTSDATSNSSQNYLQWACDYYEQRLLGNIRYLETLGALNAEKRKQKQLSVQLPAREEEASSASNTPTLSSTTNTPANTPRYSVANCFRLTRLLQRIGRERSFRVGEESTHLPEADSRLQHNHYAAIRVNIRPSVTPHSSASTPGAASYTQSKAAGAGMNDYLNANPQTVSAAISASTAAPKSAQVTEIHNSAINSNCNAASLPHEQPPQANFHALIDHLMQLEISDIDASLPKITLTDCSSSSSGVLSEYAASGVIGAYGQPAAEAAIGGDNKSTFSYERDLPSNKQVQGARRTIKLKQTKFGLPQENHQIPNEVYHRNGARPT